MKFPTKSVEKNLFKSGYGLIYAVDEVGMGCLAGPVVVCAVAVTSSLYDRHNRRLMGVRDSKMLSAKQRERIGAELLKEGDLVYSLSYAHPRTIDRLNIYNASRLAMRRAILAIRSARGDQNSLKQIVLIDGNKKIPRYDGEQMAIVSGDANVFAIACASIIAKVYRDKMMDRYAKKYPGYGFEKHKGYGTKYHQTRLMALGPSDLHRRSFRLTY